MSQPREAGHICNSICLCSVWGRLSSRRGWLLPSLLPTPMRSICHGVIPANVDGSVVAVVELQRGVKHATWLHIIAPRAHAPVIVLVLIRAFGANPHSR